MITGGTSPFRRQCRRNIRDSHRSATPSFACWSRAAWLNTRLPSLSQRPASSPLLSTCSIPLALVVPPVRYPEPRRTTGGGAEGHGAVGQVHDPPLMASGPRRAPLRYHVVRHPCLGSWQITESDSHAPVYTLRRIDLSTHGPARQSLPQQTPNRGRSPTVSLAHNGSA